MTAVAGLAAVTVTGSSCGGHPATPAAGSRPVALPAAAHPTPTLLLPTLDRALQEQTHGQYAAAVVDFLSVVKSDPGSQIAWYDLGVIAHLHGEDTQAVDDYDAALGGDPTYVPALYNLAGLETAGQPRVAATLYEKVIRLDPRNAAAHLNLGFVLLTLGPRSAAMAQLATATGLDPALSARVPVADRPRP